MGVIKPLAGMERVLLKDVLPLDTPFSVYAFPTNACNFRCNYCAHSLGHKAMEMQYGFDHGTMKLETFQAAADQMAAFPGKAKVLSLTGHGEPLLNRKLPEMIAYAKEKGSASKIEFITNASLLTRELTHRLVDAGLDCIRISLQGMNAEKYKEICGYHIEFDKFVEEIRYFYHHKKQCSVYVKVMDVALDEGDEKKFYQTFEAISDRMSIEKCKPVYAGVESTADLDVSEDRYGRRHSPRAVCPLCFFMLGIWPNGDVSPCETIYKPEVLGNVHTETLKDMWNGEKNRLFRIMQLNKERYGNQGCAGCCAPDDVSHPEDELDPCARELIKKFEKPFERKPK